MFPTLSKQLLKAKIAEDEHYVYRITAKQSPPFWVERKAKIDFTIGWSDAVEKFKGIRHKPTIARRKGSIPKPIDYVRQWGKLHPNQRKLFPTK